MAQSAHLMSLGLCRISSTKPPLPPPAGSSRPLQHPSPPEDSPQPDGLKRTGGRQTTPSIRRLPCLLCPLTLTSRRLLNVHVRSHCAGGGFSCVCCSWTADSWEELEPHWRSHGSNRRRRRVEHKQEDKGKKVAAASRPLGCRRNFRNAVSRNTPTQQTHKVSGYSCSVKRLIFNHQ